MTTGRINGHRDNCTCSGCVAGIKEAYRELRNSRRRVNKPPSQEFLAQAWEARHDDNCEVCNKEMTREEYLATGKRVHTDICLEIVLKRIEQYKYEKQLESAAKASRKQAEGLKLARLEKNRDKHVSSVQALIDLGLVTKEDFTW